MLTEQTITHFFELLTTRNLEQMATLLSEDARLHFPKTQPLIGRDRILKFFQVLFRQYPELSFEVQRIIIQGDRAAAHWVNRGVSRKKEPYANEGVTLFEFHGAKIRFLSDFFKDTGKF
jgi:uncharacterized protein (TIGR02246 family)